MAQKVWAQDSEHSLDHGVTTMDASGYTTREGLFSRMLNAVDEHHGEWSHEPPWTSVHVYGIQASDAIVHALAAYGATDIQHKCDHFVATRIMQSKA